MPRVKPYQENEVLSTAVVLRKDVFVKTTRFPDGNLQALILNLEGDEIFETGGLAARVALELRSRLHSPMPADKLVIEIAGALGNIWSAEEIAQTISVFEKMGIIGEENPPSPGKGRRVQGRTL